VDTTINHVKIWDFCFQSAEKEKSAAMSLFDPHRLSSDNFSMTTVDYNYIMLIVTIGDSQDREFCVLFE
jgi:hypothetical protein